MGSDEIPDLLMGRLWALIANVFVIVFLAACRSCRAEDRQMLALLRPLAAHLNFGPSLLTLFGAISWYHNMLCKLLGSFTLRSLH